MKLPRTLMLKTGKLDPWWIGVIVSLAGLTASLIAPVAGRFLAMDRIRSSATFQNTHASKLTSGTLRWVAFSPDGRFMAYCAEEEVVFSRIVFGMLTRRHSPWQAVREAFPKESWLAETDGTAWKAMKLPKHFEVRAVHPSGRECAGIIDYPNSRTAVYRYDVEKEELLEIPLEGRALPLAYSPKGGKLLISNNNRLKVLHLASGELVDLEQRDDMAFWQSEGRIAGLDISGRPGAKRLDRLWVKDPFGTLLLERGGLELELQRIIRMGFGADKTILICYRLESEAKPEINLLKIDPRTGEISREEIPGSDEALTARVSGSQVFLGIGRELVIDEGGINSILRYDPGTDTTRTIAQFPDQTFASLAWFTVSPDARWIVFWARPESAENPALWVAPMPEREES